MFNWLINYFKSTKVELPKEDELDDILSQNRVKLIQKDVILPKEEINRPKPIKEEVMSEPTDYYEQLKNVWLIVVDTTGLDKNTRDYNEQSPDGEGYINDARKLGPLCIKTFGFVNAPNINAAKGLFWRTLAIKNKRTRGFLPEIARATRITNFTQIFPMLTRIGAVWNYVGGPKEALPGQQSAISKQKDLVGRNNYGDESARDYQPTAPVLPDEVQTKVTQEDLSGLSAEDRKIVQGGGQSSMPMMPNGPMNPQQMMQMMQMMMQMMQGGQAQPPLPPPTISPTTTADNLSAEDRALIDQSMTPISPNESDPDLQKEIEIMRENGKVVDTSAFDDDVDPKELAEMAKRSESIKPRSFDEVE